MMSAALVFLLRTRLTIDGTSARVVNAFRSWAVETSEVAFFERSRPRFDWNRSASTMRLRNGDAIRVHALSAPQMFPNGRAARILELACLGRDAIQ
jgi:hypothetical protein